MTLINKQILLIEDDLIDQMAFSRMFKNQLKDFDYSIANSIEEAKILLQKNSFDVVISDFNLADGTTLDLLKDLSETPLIIITGNEDDATVSTAKLTIGAAACFTKDLDLQYLDRIPKTIQSILNKKSFSLDLNAPVYFKQPTDKKEYSPVEYDLKRITDIFDGNKKLIKETINVFIKHKVIELEELKKYVFEEEDCKKIKKLVHKMQSGFRVFGMTSQEDTAGQIEALATQCSKDEDQQIKEVDFYYQKLNEETHIAIDLLKKELSNY